MLHQAPLGTKIQEYKATAGEGGGVEVEPETWVGHQVSVHLDIRASSEPKAIGVLELMDDAGVVVAENEEVIAFYPWNSIVAIKVGELEEPSQRRSTRERPERQVEDPSEPSPDEPRSGPRGPSGPSRRPQGPSGPSRRPEGPRGPGRR